MNKKPSNKVSTKIQTSVAELKSQKHEQRLASFNTELYIGGTVTPDPFVMPSAGNPYANFELWESLEDKQHFSDPPHPLAYRGSLNHDWHSFLRGALSPFMEAFGVLSPVGGGWTPVWAVNAARQTLKALKRDSAPARPYSVGWCLGFGITATGQFEEWGVSLKQFAKASPNLRHYLFNQAAERAENNVEVARSFFSGFCDGLTSGQQIEGEPHHFKWQLFVALNWFELQHLSRLSAAKHIREAIKTKSDPRSEDRQILKLLAKVEFPKAATSSSNGAKTP